MLQFRNHPLELFAFILGIISTMEVICSANAKKINADLKLFVPSIPAVILRTMSNLRNVWSKKQNNDVVTRTRRP